jgi:hypothetical protein
MMRRAILALALALAAPAAWAASVLPADVSTRVGRAQTFVFHWTDPQYTAANLQSRDYIWHGVHSNASTNMLLPSGVYTSLYTSNARVPNVPIHYGAVLVPGWTLSYFQNGTGGTDPSWIMLQGDHATPAYWYNDNSYIPLDISNSAVRAWRMTNEIAPMISSGVQGISIDNMGPLNNQIIDLTGTATITNGSIDVTGISLSSSLSQIYVGGAVTGFGIQGGTTVASIISPTEIHLSQTASASTSVTLTFPHYAVGTCTVAVTDYATGGTCESHGGTFTAKYKDNSTGECSGSSTPCWTNDQVTWVQQIEAYAHPLTVGVTGNVTPSMDGGTYQTLSQTLIEATDIWLDEGGWMGGSLTPAPCLVGGSPPLLGAAWATKANFIIGLNNGAGHPRIDQNALCPLGTRTSQVLEWALGSHLLTKKTGNDYFEWQFTKSDGSDDSTYFTDQLIGGQWPQFWWTHGAATTAMLTDGHLYWRYFTNGLAICNPTADATASFDFGADVYHSFDNLQYPPTPTVTTKVNVMGPLCLVLKKGGAVWGDRVYLSK